MKMIDNDIREYLKLTEKLEPNVILETVKFIESSKLLDKDIRKEISSFFKDAELRADEFIIIKGLENEKIKVIAFLTRRDGIIVNFEISFVNGKIKIDYLFSEKDWIEDSREKTIFGIAKGAPNNLVIVSVSRDGKVTKVRNFMKNILRETSVENQVEGTLMSQVYIDNKAYCENFFTGETFDGSFLEKISENELIEASLKVLREDEKR